MSYYNPYEPQPTLSLTRKVLVVLTAIITIAALVVSYIAP